LRLPALPAPFGIPWPVIGIVAAVVLLWGVFHFFAESVRAEERQRAAEHVAAIQTEAAEAIRQEAAAFRARAGELDRSLARSIEALETVPHDAPAADFLIVWARADRSLYDGAPG
jgi:type VI protein secretion system component VasK